MKAITVMSTIGRASKLAAAIAVLSVCWTAAAQANANMKQIILSNPELPGYSLFYQGERDWALFTADTGAPAPCLQGKPIANGTEQIWRRSDQGDPLQGRVRIDYALFESAGEAASAANAAALLSNNATAKIDSDKTVGDAAWRTIAGSPALIVQRGPAVIYLSGQGDQSVSESDLARIAGRVIQKIDGVPLKSSSSKLACEIETYLGLNLIQPSQAETFKRIAREIALGGSSSRRAVSELKKIVSAQSAKGIQREAAVNLIRAASSLAD
jgi:hypothetical protein